MKKKRYHHIEALKAAAKAVDAKAEQMKKEPWDYFCSEEECEGIHAALVELARRLWERAGRLEGKC